MVVNTACIVWAGVAQGSAILLLQASCLENNGYMLHVSSSEAFLSF